MDRRRILTLAAIVAAAGASSAGAAASARRLTVTPALHRGWIGLRIAGGVPRADASVSERGRVVGHVRLDVHGAATAGRAVAWSCVRRRRRLTVGDGASSTIVTVRTPGCARRVTVSVSPRRPRAGRQMVLTLRDRWGLGGVAVRACLVAPAGSRPCVPRRLGTGPAPLRLAAPRPGRWRLAVHGRGIDETRPLRILPHGPVLRILMVGDSLMPWVASALTERLTPRGADVIADIRYGTGLSDSTLGDWRRRLRRETRELSPDVVVLFMGGADTYPIGAIRCCGRRWQAAYGRRARRVAVTAMRGGAAQVYWLTLPAPLDPERAVDWGKENSARAAGLAALAPWTTELDTSAILTPGYVFRRSMRIDGRETKIRTDDGMHLTPAAGRLLAARVDAALRSDRVGPRPG